MMSMPGFGNIHDNEAAFLVAASSINAGDIDTGEQILTQLREHIIQSGEIKSRMWLLPQIVDVIERCAARKAAA
jgi:hypothetical protein